MKIITIILRILLGLVFVVFGLNGFFHFLNQQPKTPPPPAAMQFVSALMTSGYFYVVAALQVLGGILLLIGRFVALGLVLLGPVIVNILLFHVFLNHERLGIAVPVFLVGAFLVWSERGRFAPIFRP